MLDLKRLGKLRDSSGKPNNALMHLEGLNGLLENLAYVYLMLGQQFFWFISIIVTWYFSVEIVWHEFWH